MGDSGGRRTSQRLERWELELVQHWAASFQLADIAALESDLLMHVLTLKREKRPIKNWKAYLRVALRHWTFDWIRDHRGEELVSLDAPLPNLPYPEDEGATLLDVLKSPEPDLDFFVSIGALLNECDPWLAAVWRALLQTDGNLTRAAIRLRVHRNTVRAAIKRIVELLRDHGFGDRR